MRDEDSGQKVSRTEKPRLAIVPQVERVCIPDGKAMMAALRILLGLPRIPNQEKGNGNICKSR